MELVGREPLWLIHRYRRSYMFDIAETLLLLTPHNWDDEYVCNCWSQWDGDVCKGMGKDRGHEDD